MVDSTIGLMSFDVFVSIFYRGDSEDDEKGQNYETRRYRGEFGEELENCDPQEESKNIVTILFFSKQTLATL